MTTLVPSAHDELERLQTRVASLEQERRHLLALVEILQEIGGSLHFVDIVQSVARRLGETFGLDRCSVFLVERGTQSARLVASYEDPSIKNYTVDLARYPELERAFRLGQTVFIADAATEPELAHIRGALEGRGAKSITVVPISWRGAAIGAIFLRTLRDGPGFSESDIQFTQAVASLTSRALRAAYRYERLQQRGDGGGDGLSARDRERVAMLGFLRRLLDVFADREGPLGETVLARASSEEIDRLVEVAMTVVVQEATGA